MRNPRRWMATIAAAVVVVAAAAAVLLLSEPRVVWCRIGPSGSIWSISTEPDGSEVPHAATMTSDEAPWAYYYADPTRYWGLKNRFASGPDIIHLLATGRETTTKSGRWREFRRCRDEEFEVVLASWEKRGGS